MRGSVCKNQFQLKNQLMIMKHLPPKWGQVLGILGGTTFFRPCPISKIYEITLSTSVYISEKPSILWTTILLSHGPPHGDISGQYSTLVPTYPYGWTIMAKVQMSNLPLKCGKG